MIPEGAEKNLWDKLEVSYFLNNEAKEIAWHTRLLNRYVDTPHPVIKARLSEGDEGLHVLVYTQDQPKLFARICAFFEHINYSIADAKIYTTRDGYALDTFHVFIPTHEQTRDYRNMKSFIEVELYTALSTPCFPHLTHSRRISRHLKHFPIAPQVIIQATERTPFYSLSIISGDQPGLLARIAQVLAEHTISVHSAKIMTLGSRVEDSFLITGPGLDDAKNTMKIEQELIEVARL